VIVSLLYQLTRRLLSVPTVLLRRDAAKDNQMCDFVAMQGAGTRDEHILELHDDVRLRLDDHSDDLAVDTEGLRAARCAGRGAGASERDGDRKVEAGTRSHEACPDVSTVEVRCLFEDQADQFTRRFLPTERRGECALNLRSTK
jgi:hypothetical protein